MKTSLKCPTNAILSPGVLVILAICAIVGCVGGVNLILLKHQAEQIDYAIAESEARARKHVTDTATENMRFRQLIDRYALAEALRIQGSTLAERSLGEVDTIVVPSVTRAPTRLADSR